MAEISRTGILLIILIHCLSGCSSIRKSYVWTADPQTISESTEFEIRQTADLSGMVVSQKLLTYLTDSLREEFTSRHLRIAGSANADGQVLIVQTEILVYKFQAFTGPPPPSRNIVGLCILLTRLVRKDANRPSVEIRTINQIDVGRGLLEPKNPEELLQKVAVFVAENVSDLQEN